MQLISDYMLFAIPVISCAGLLAGYRYIVRGANSL